jgi:hypothetical protein
VCFCSSHAHRSGLRTTVLRVRLCNKWLLLSVSSQMAFCAGSLSTGSAHVAFRTRTENAYHALQACCIVITQLTLYVNAQHECWPTGMAFSVSTIGDETVPSREDPENDRQKQPFRPVAPNAKAIAITTLLPKDLLADRHHTSTTQERKSDLLGGPYPRVVRGTLPSPA